MANEILFAGGGYETLSAVSGAYPSTNTNYFDAAYSDHAIILDSSTDRFAEFEFRTGADLALGSVTTGETLFAHWLNCSQGGATVENTYVELRDASNHPWFRLRVPFNSANILRPQYNSGTGASPTWTDLGGADIVASSGEKEKYDIEITLGSPHSINIYKGNTLVSTGTFTQALLTSLSKIRFFFCFSTSGPYIGNGISEVLITRGIPTIGALVASSRGTADGANTDWSGAYTDVNEAVMSDASLQSSTVAGQKETHVMSNITVPAGYSIDAVFHWMRAKNDGVAPTNLRSVLRSGSTDYSSVDVATLGVGYRPVGIRYLLDPVGASWTAANYNSLEVGYESAT